MSGNQLHDIRAKKNKRYNWASCYCQTTQKSITIHVMIKHQISSNKNHKITTCFVHAEWLLVRTQSNHLVLGWPGNNSCSFIKSLNCTTYSPGVCYKPPAKTYSTRALDHFLVQIRNNNTNPFVQHSKGLGCC